MQHSDGKLFRLFVLIRQCFLLVVSDLFYCSVMLVIDDDGDEEEECVCVYVCVCVLREREGDLRRAVPNSFLLVLLLLY